MKKNMLETTPKMVAILLPCYNEGMSIRQTVINFQSVLPEALIYVYDNLSTDNTREEALAGGAIVKNESWQGKGNVVKRMFSDINADIYIMADGDGTYDYKMAPKMVELLQDGHLDMVVGVRQNVYDNAHRAGHGFGNRLFNYIYRTLFGQLFTDIFSGYRVFSKRFVKSFPAVSSGFEIETEMSVHANQLRMPIAEISTIYGSRQEGSTSKLRTFRDGFKILLTFIILFKEIRPLQFFGLLALAIFAIAIAISTPLFITYTQTGFVPRFPTAILATGLMIFGGIFLMCGLILDSVARGRLEQKRMWYKSITSN